MIDPGDLGPRSPGPLTGIRACVFDAYGTLFDFGSAAAVCRDVLGDDVGPLTALWRDKQIAYSWWRATTGRHADFRQVTADALDYSLAALRLDTPGLRTRLLALYDTLLPFPEVPAVLRTLKDRGFATAILSNGSPSMLATAVAAAGIGEHLDHVLSVEEVGVFKPHSSVYQLAVDRLGVPASAIAFQSSNGWDAHAASAFGMRVVWCNRDGRPAERLPGAPDRVAGSLADLPELLSS